MRKLMALVGLSLVGCGGVNPSKNPDPVEVTGKVAFASGKPVTGVTLNFQPIADGGQAFAPVKDGAFKGAVMPGKYTYFFTEGPRGSSPAAFAAIPEKYRAGAMDRQVEIKPGATVNITLE